MAYTIMFKYLQAAACVVLMPLAAQAATVSSFYDSSYVDTSREALNIRSQATTLGNSVSTFTGTDQANWAAAMTGVDALLIPELERSALTLDSATRSDVADFVGSGGNLVVSASYANNEAALLNAIFGWSLTGGSGSGAMQLQSAAAGTDFAGGPATLASLNGTYDLLLSSLPSSATAIYADSNSARVFSAEVGAGSVTFLAYDWYDTATDADWGAVLNTALNVDVSPVPLPAGLPLLLAGLGGLVALRRRQSRD
ncbi:hypothetical protein Salmuc_04082 [Salipiger mucosus DSM 16094]|uniref:VPLPA-CTERM protein sorting domain-containing protein n=2 Tax=Salipiger mucosus TaxID=263378 RepID=S9QRU1_9RHOB|nr:hypothetical protein Salmuc_04082 [Salipiger mucosus DSM 16094]